ncbi:MAG: universal stress protein [Pseudomonadota bacterium]
MKRILVVADAGRDQGTIQQAVEMATRLKAKLDIVGFVYEHLQGLPIDLHDSSLDSARQKLIASHKKELRAALKAAGGKRSTGVEVHWEKRVAERVASLAEDGVYDLVIKGGHRSETAFYTPTDWQLLRLCKVPVLLLAKKRWKKSQHVLAAVDLGTRVASKRALNFDIVAAAHFFAQALGAELHVTYAIPFSTVLHDLDLIDRNTLRRKGQARAKAFTKKLADNGIEVTKMHVVTGEPEKTLINVAAKNGAGVVVLGCIGRKKFAGRVLGNTAEKILRLLKANVLAIKP